MIQRPSPSLKCSSSILHSSSEAGKLGRGCRPRQLQGPRPQCRCCHCLSCRSSVLNSSFHLPVTDKTPFEKSTTTRFLLSFYIKCYVAEQTLELWQSRLSQRSRQSRMEVIPCRLECPSRGLPLPLPPGCCQTHHGCCQTLTWSACKFRGHRRRYAPTCCWIQIWLVCFADSCFCLA